MAAGPGPAGFIEKYCLRIFESNLFLQNNLRVAEAKSFLVLAVKRKTLYSDYLESVVSTVKEEYKDVITLMERCQCLVMSRYLLLYLLIT